MRRQRRLIRWRSLTAAAVAVLVIATGTFLALRPRPYRVEFALAPAGVNAAWLAVTERVAPDAKWIPFADRRVRDTAPPLEAPGNGVFHASGLIEAGGVSGRFSLYIADEWPITGPTRCRDAAASCRVDPFWCPDDAVCSVELGPRGTIIGGGRSTYELGAHSTPVTVLSIEVMAPDRLRTAVMSVSNLRGWGDSPAATTDLPLTEDQVRSILLEPGLLF